MGMKKNNMSMALLAMGGMMGGELPQIVVEQTNPKPKRPFKPTPFHKQEGIAKMIKEYNLIQSGKSKQSKMKQGRTIFKIENYLSEGNLTLEHLKL